MYNTVYVPLLPNQSTLALDADSIPGPMYYSYNTHDHQYFHDCCMTCVTYHYCNQQVISNRYYPFVNDHGPSGLQGPQGNQGARSWRSRKPK